MANLTELLKQRRAIAEHLEWLDQEIAAAGGTTTALEPLAEPASVAPPEQTPEELLAKLKLSKREEQAPPPSAPSIDLPNLDPIAHSLIDQYQTEAVNSPQDAKRGCLLLFGSGLLLLAVGLITLYFVKYY